MPDMKELVDDLRERLATAREGGSASARKKPVSYTHLRAHET